MSEDRGATGLAADAGEGPGEADSTPEPTADLESVELHLLLPGVIATAPFSDLSGVADISGFSTPASPKDVGPMSFIDTGEATAAGPTVLSPLPSIFRVWGAADLSFSVGRVAPVPSCSVLWAPGVLSL